jgi:hypothetical protein
MISTEFKEVADIVSKLVGAGNKAFLDPLQVGHTGRAVPDQHP